MADRAGKEQKRSDSDVIAECEACDERGIATSAITGARGTCRHSRVTYKGHLPECDSLQTTPPQQSALGPES